MPEVPYASRPFGWCQDYEHGPAAQHRKCDGQIAIVGSLDPHNYLCPCWCHEEGRMGPWEIVLPLTKPLSMNDRKHWSEQSKDVAQLRNDTGWLIRQAKIPPCEKIRVTLVYEPRTAGRRDAINLMATLKPVQDAFVDLGIIPDDVPDHIDTVAPMIDAPNGKKGKLWCLVEKLA